MVANEQWAGAVHPPIRIGSWYCASTDRLMPSGVIRVEASSDWAKEASPERARCAAGDSAVASCGAGSVSTTTASSPSPHPHPAAANNAATIVPTILTRFDHTIPEPPLSRPVCQVPVEPVRSVLGSRFRRNGKGAPVSLRP